MSGWVSTDQVGAGLRMEPAVRHASVLRSQPRPSDATWPRPSSSASAPRENEMIMMVVTDRTQSSAGSSASRSLRRRPGRVTPPRRPIRRRDRHFADRGAALPRPQVAEAGAQVAGTHDIASTGSASGIALSRIEELGGASLLRSDLRVALLLANEARYRTIERVFGVPRDQANLVTLIGAVTLAAAVHDKVKLMITGPGGPTRGEALIGANALKDLVYAIGGPSARDTPLLGTLVATAVIGGLARPAVRGSVKEIKAFSHGIKGSFGHRYGHQHNGHLRRRISS